MKKLLYFILSCFLCTNAWSADTVKSPDGSLSLVFEVANDAPKYSLFRNEVCVLKPSSLGLDLNNGVLQKNLKVIKRTRSSFDNIWEQPWGEQRLVRNNYNSLVVSMKEKNGLKRSFDVEFRVFNDGIGFRYIIPEQSNISDFEIKDELTEFVFPSDNFAWSQPTNGTNYYEAVYTRDLLSQKDTVSTPITIETADNLFLSIHEANLTDYASLNLTTAAFNNGCVSMRAALTPWQSGVKVYGSAPFTTPWRTVVVASLPGDLITSRLILNLNEPCALSDISWLETGRYVGIWWGMHMETYSWHQGPKHGATTEITKRYIDFAAKHGFKGVLVEGWNYGWDGDWTQHGDLFDFVRPYPDYDLVALQKYALDKGVRLIAHNETGGASTNYENQLDTAFALYHALGINSVKTGYVNPLLDGKELQHSQYGIRHYRKVIEAAAKHNIMVVNHEPAMPSGLRRTFPNIVSGEGMRGQEYNAWSADGGNPPYHVCILPFTRGLAGPMDFTPGIFNFKNKVVPATHPQTTVAKQLAEYVLLYSPWQMAADMIENYEYHPALSFIESCPTDWETTVVPLAEIGRHLTIARKERNGDNWFVGSATDADAREFDLPLDFLDDNSTYQATIYEDGPDADYRTNPYPLTIRQIDVNKYSVLHLKLAPSGGTAIRIIKQ